MKKTLQLWAALAGLAAFSATVTAQSTPPANQPDPRTSPQERKGPAETSLVGVSLYDTGLKIVTKFGSPDDIQPLTLGGGGGNAGGGGSDRGGPPAGGGRGGGGGGGSSNTRDGGGGGGGGRPLAPPPSTGGAFNIPIDENDALPGFIGDPFNFRRQDTMEGGSDRASGGGGSNTRGGGGGGAPPLGGGDRGGAGGGGGGATDRVTVTRWTYNLGAKRYSFILDKFNRVVQIEAIGLPNKSVKTRRGVMLGCPFSQLIKLYGAPDGYEIGGDTIVVRYLVFDRVAFRLQRLKANQPHQVTGIVVAAGKT